MERNRTTLTVDAATRGAPTVLSDIATETSRYLNRELSWLAFNGRVLEEALDERQPLLERVKFLAIVGTNLDEFFLIRVAGIKQQVAAGVAARSPDGMTPAEQFVAIRQVVERDIARQRACWLADLQPRLRAGHLCAGLRRAERAAGRLLHSVLRARGLPGAHAAGVRSPPPVSAHLQLAYQPGRSDQRPGGGRAVRASRCRPCCRA